MLIFDSVAHVVLGLDTNSFPCLFSKFRRKLRFRLYRFAVYHVYVICLEPRSVEFRLTKLKTVPSNDNKFKNRDL